MHDLTWVPEVKELGIQWDRPEVAVGRFFGISELYEKHGNEGFTYEDEFISVRHRPESWGLTTVHIKKKKITNRILMTGLISLKQETKFLDTSRKRQVLFTLMI